MISRLPQNIAFTCLLSAVLGSLLTFSFAPYELFPLAVLMPAGLLALILNRSPRQSFLIGYCFGLGLFGAGVYWVYHSIHTIGEVPFAFSLAITSGFIAILAFFPGLSCYYTNRYFSRPLTTTAICAFPAIWVLSEWIRSFLFTGFPWLFLGYSQTNSPLKGYAPILSVYGVSLAVLLSSGLLITCYHHYRDKHFRLLYSKLGFISAIWIVGALLTYIPWTTPYSKPLSVALVQGNIPQAMKWSPEHVQLSLDRYEQLTSPLWGKYDVIIWPEAAVPLALQDAENYINRLDDKATETKTALILGIPIQNKTGDGYYNSLVTLGSTHAVYNKRLLVPFGEYIPFSKQFANLFTFMNVPMSNMVPGNTSPGLLSVAGVNILPAICYEVGFPSLTFTQDKTLGLILTLTNDAWFGHSNAQAQHLQMAQMRSIELQRPALFVSNDGITAIINAQGKITSAAQPYQTAVLTGSIQPTNGLTPWMFNGLDPILFIAICLLITAYRAQKKLFLTKNLVKDESSFLSNKTSSKQKETI